MNSETLPILYANDGCPYVFRARLALIYSGIEVEHREVRLDNKPPAMLEASAKGTVPILVLPDGSVIDESWDIVRWAIGENDPEAWGGEDNSALELAERLAKANDSKFGLPSMYYKFPDYYPDRDRLQDRTDCEPFLDELENRLSKQRFMHGDRISVADVPVYPAVSGFARIEPDWFSGRFPNIAGWLERMSASPHVRCVKFGHKPWQFDRSNRVP